MPHPLTWLVTSLIFIGSVHAAPEELSKILEQTRVAKRMPGLRAAIRYPDGRIVRAAVGIGDREAATPLDNLVGMPGGSTGKSFAAALTMLLIEDGTLSLDDPASKWLGKTEWYGKLPNSQQIKVRHLLSHSSGIPDYPATVAFRAAMVWRAIRTGSARFEPEELITFSHANAAPFSVGQGFRYTDSGYLVLGRLIEAASGQSYYDLLQERILGPQKLDRIYPQDKSVLVNIVPGYVSGARNLKPDGRMKFDPSSEWTGGGLVTTPTMLVKFFGELAEGRIVRPKTLSMMLAGEWQNPQEPSWRYGYGLFVYDDGASFGHAGLWSGYRSDVRHYTESGVTIAVQTNRDGRMELERLLDRLAAAAEHLQHDSHKTPDPF